MHIVYQTLNQLFQAALVYVFLIFGYSNVSDAADCGSFQTVYHSTAPNNVTVTSSLLFKYISSVSDPANCSTTFAMTSLEYQNLIKLPIQQASINIQTLQTNTTTLQNNIQTVNNSLQTVADLVAAQNTRIEELETLVNSVGNGSGILRDKDNILHINHDDAMTLFYAVMGLFATAFTWRFVRDSLNVGDKYVSAE